MKLTMAILLSFLSFSAFALVESKNCPEKFSITYSNITRAPLSSEIEDSWSVKAGWSTVTNDQSLAQEFKISTRSDTALCVYTNGKVAVFLQTNDGVDELLVPYNYNVYFRTKVLSFSNDYIELAVDKDSKNIFAPILQIDSDGGVNAAGEVKVGEAEAVNVEVL